MLTRKTLKNILIRIKFLLLVTFVASNANGAEILPFFNEHTDSVSTTGDFTDEIDFDMLPAWEMYGIWDTINLDPYEFDYTKISEPYSLCLFWDTNAFVMPILGRTCVVNSEFAPRWGRYHKGIDLELETGDTVVTVFDGVVRISAYSPTFGHYVVVRHFNGLETLYAHLSERKVYCGAIVKAGDILGLGGNTGRSHGSHLHFETRFLGKPFNPEAFVSFADNTLLSDELVIDKSTFHYMAEAKKMKVYVVKKGDTLSAIARKNGTTVSKLCQINKIKPTTILQIGRKLTIR